MKRVPPFLLALLAVLLPLVVVGCGKPEFKIANLTVNPKQVEKGQNTTISVDVSNSGNAEGKYSAVLMVDGTESAEQTVVVKPSSTETVTFSVSKTETGSHSVAVGELSDSFSVLRPAEFSFGALTVFPQQVAAGAQATVTIEVTNGGEVKGDCPVTLKVADKDVETRTVLVGPGATEKVCFTFTRNEPGKYSVAVGTLTDTLIVLRPAEFRVVNVNIAPPQVVVYWPAVVTATVSNTGELSGSTSVTLTEGANTIETKSVSVSPGGTESVGFTVVKEQAGTYSLSVGGQSQVLTVLPFRYGYLTYVGLNTRTALFNNPKVRLAFYMAIDRDSLARSVQTTYGVSLEKVTALANPLLSSTSVDKKTDMARARQLLTEAGYRNGFKVAIAVSSADQKLLSAATWMKTQLAAVGIDLEIRVYEQAVYQAQLLAGTLQCFLQCRAVNSGGKAGLVGSLLLSDSSANYVKYSDATFDRLWSNGLLTDAEEQAFQNPPLVPLFWSVESVR